jgi:predicted DNA-binding protein (MmcQ/YjbR family)
MAVSREQIDAICSELPGATPAHPPELVSWKVGGKMFACFGGDGVMDGVSVKCTDTDTAAMLIDSGVAVRAPYFHASWVRLIYSDTDLADAQHRIELSYDIVRTSLPKAARSALAPRKGA